jgi:thiol-disulfide isomerase/thioredoxin
LNFNARSPVILVATAFTAAALGLMVSVAWFGAGPALQRSPLGKWLFAQPAKRAASLYGQPVAPFELPGIAGGRMKLPTGRPLLINYWASWCEPCRREMPVLDAYARSHGAAGTQFVGIALDTPHAAQGFLQATPVSFPILVEEPGGKDSSVRMGDGPGVLPFSVLIDAQGRLRASHVGPFGDAAELDAFLAKGR